MVLFIDTNVLLDVLQAREGFVEDSLAIWELCELGQAKGVISSLSVFDIMYVMRKTLDAGKIQSVVAQLGSVFEIADLRASDVRRASAMHWNDFEDAVQACVAKRCGAELIIKRNVADFETTDMAVMTPEHLIRSVQQ